MGTILVTGGAGYIGSHVVRQLVERGERVVVLDNLSHRLPQAVLGAPLVVGDTGDRELVARVLREHGVDTVMHFAAHTIVPESVVESAQVLRQQHLRHAQPARVLRPRGREALRVLVDRGGVRHAGRRRGARGHADRADQPLRHLQADERVDAARPGRGVGRCATWRCAISTSPAPTRAAASATRRRRPRC